MGENVSIRVAKPTDEFAGCAEMVGRAVLQTEPGVLMPELGRTVVDQKSIDLIRAWIAGMDSSGDGVDAG